MCIKSRESVKKYLCSKFITLGLFIFYGNGRARVCVCKGVKVSPSTTEPAAVKKCA